MQGAKLYGLQCWNYKKKKENVPKIEATEMKIVHGSEIIQRKIRMSTSGRS